MGVLGFLASTITISQFSKIRYDQALQSRIILADSPISITLTGAVQSPGTYQVQPGTTVKQLLKRVPLSKSALRKKVPFRKVFYASQTIHIPQKKRENSVK